MASPSSSHSRVDSDPSSMPVSAPPQPDRLRALPSSNADFANAPRSRKSRTPHSQRVPAYCPNLPSRGRNGWRRIRHSRISFFKDYSDRGRNCDGRNQSPTATAAENCTAQQVADAGGPDAIWTLLNNRLWTEYLGAVRDGSTLYSPDSTPPRRRRFSILIRRKLAFAVRAYHCLANPFQAGDRGGCSPELHAAERCGVRCTCWHNDRRASFCSDG